MSMAYFSHNGTYICQSGWCSTESEAIESNAGLTVVFSELPMNPSMPPTLGSMWNIKTNKWDAPEIPVEQKVAETRYKRTQLMAACDWTDTLSAKTRLGDAAYEAWQTYRQSLRDITLQADPFNIVWPVAPQ